MGQEILYCAKCQSQLRSAQFEKRTALRFEGQAWCLACAEASIPTLPPDAAVRLGREIELLKNPTAPKPVSLGSSSRLSTVPPPRPAASASKNRVWGVAAVGLALAVILGLMIGLRSGGARTELSQTSTPPSEAPPPRPPVEAPVRPNPPSPHEAARVALEAAKAAGRTHPEDPAARLGLWEEAARRAELTPFADEARRGLEAARAEERSAAEARLDLNLGQAMEREDFGWILRTADASKSRYPDPAWAGKLEERKRSAVQRSRDLFEFVRDQAAAQRKADPKADLDALRDRVVKWGIESLVAEFDRALADTSPPPSKPPPPERPSGSAAFALACRLASARAYAEAQKGLEAAARSAAEAPAKAELAMDISDLRLAAQAVASAVDVLIKSPRDRNLAIRVSDEAGREKTVEGTLIQADGAHLELKTAQGTLAVPMGEVSAPFLSELFLKRAGTRAPTDARAARLLLLFEGRAEEARALPPGEGAELPDRYWSASEEIAAARRSAPEAEARKLLWRAEQDTDRGFFTFEGLLRLLRLSMEFSETAVYLRSKPHILKRLELGRDYVYGADDLRKAGAFARTVTKAGLILSSESDTPAERRGESFAELELVVLQDTSYRCWVYVGGCCAETFTFFAQGSEMSSGSLACEPGGPGFAPVKHSLGSVIRTHAAHGGKKQPSRWGWVEILLPKYAVPGTKVLRLVSDQQGFSVAAVVVSSTRTGPPPEPELKKALATRPLSLKSPGPPPDVWWDFDTLAGNAFADRGKGALPAPMQGATTAAGGIRGRALSFDGTSGLRIDPGTILNSPDLTLTLWMKPAGGGGRLGLISSRTGPKETPFVLCQSGRSIQFEAAKGVSSWFSFNSPSVLSEGAWTHVGVVCKKDEGVTLFIDGKQVASKSVPEGRLPWSECIMLGSESWGGDPPRGETPGRYRGLLDEIKIWTRCLRPDEIEGEFNRR